jgi:hypothetical protein
MAGFQMSTEVTGEFAEKPLEFCSRAAYDVGVGCDRDVRRHVHKHPRIELLPQDYDVDRLQLRDEVIAVLLCLTDVSTVQGMTGALELHELIALPELGEQQ